MEIWSEVDGTWGWLGCGEKQMMLGGLLVCGTLYFLFNLWTVITVPEARRPGRRL